MPYSSGWGSRFAEIITRKLRIVGEVIFTTIMMKILFPLSQRIAALRFVLSFFLIFTINNERNVNIVNEKNDVGIFIMKYVFFLEIYCFYRCCWLKIKTCNLEKRYM